MANKMHCHWRTVHATYCYGESTGQCHFIKINSSSSLLVSNMNEVSLVLAVWHTQYTWTHLYVAKHPPPWYSNVAGVSWWPTAWPRPLITAISAAASAPLQGGWTQGWSSPCPFRAAHCSRQPWGRGQSGTLHRRPTSQWRLQLPLHPGWAAGLLLMHGLLYMCSKMRPTHHAMCCCCAVHPGL